MSNHEMESVEEFCDNIIILNRGNTLVKGNLEEIKDSYPIKQFTIETSEKIDSYIDECNLKVDSAKENTYIIGIETPQESQKLLDILTNKNIMIKKFELMKPSLHDIFVEKVGEDNERF